MRRLLSRFLLFSLLFAQVLLFALFVLAFAQVLLFALLVLAFVLLVLAFAQVLLFCAYSCTGFRVLCSIKSFDLPFVCTECAANDAVFCRCVANDLWFTVNSACAQGVPNQLAERGVRSEPTCRTRGAFRANLQSAGALGFRLVAA